MSSDICGEITRTRIDQTVERYYLLAPDDKFFNDAPSMSTYVRHIQRKQKRGFAGHKRKRGKKMIDASH